MMLYNTLTYCSAILTYCCGPKTMAVLTTLAALQPNGNDDPGMPGGDPDLPNAPLDSGIYVLFAVLIIYGMYKINRKASKL
jgi:hypothetical protein